MTRKQIEALEWRGLDAAIAEKVMGVPAALRAWSTEDFALCPRYSQDPAAFCALWGKLVADGWTIDLKQNQAGCAIALSKFGSERVPSWTEGRYYCLDRYVALCRAALLAYTEAR